MKKYFTLFLALLLLSIACTDPNEIVETPVDIDDPVTTLDDPINGFVWRGLNDAYYWQEDVPNLADSKKSVQNDYYKFLNGYSDSENLFESLLFDKGNTDRFSWYIEDYNVHNDLSRGVSDSFGFDFGLVRLCSTCDDILGFISFVVPDSPASDAGLKRGDLFYTFNGTVLTMDNYQVVNGYYRDNNISMGFANLVDGAIVPNNTEVDLALRIVVENPVFYSDVITNEQGTKIGYLVYNGFKYTYHEELNEIFTKFKAENVQELVLDLRYNGGGSVETTVYLASMIHAGASTSDLFEKVKYNSKNYDENYTLPFFNEARIYSKEGYYNYTGNDIVISRLSSLSRMFVITSNDTASASEMIINGLSPFIDVIKVGTTTYGKNVGSYTVYDSADFTINNANPNHTVAMQPITFKIFNKLDQSDYTQGFTPDYEVIDYVSQMKAFGDIEETLLKATLDIISGNVAKVYDLKRYELEKEMLFKSLDHKRFSKEMYMIPK
jgi:carboxyl-terminal processing protease